MTHNPKRALITGVAGQDGTYLSQLLHTLGYEVYGALPSKDSSQYCEHKSILDENHVCVLEMDITDKELVRQTVAKYRFDEIYNLAGLSNVAESFGKPEQTFLVNANSVLNLLEAVREESPQTRLYQASSSELFGGIPESSPQNEETAFHPRSPYGVSKLAAHWLVINYRESYGLNCCAGILFNHESPRRGGFFLTKKVCNWVKEYQKGENDGPLILGNLEARRDWGHSKDFVRAMWMMLNSDSLDDPFKKDPPVFKEFVVGTGKSYSIKEFVEKALQQIDRKIVWKTTGEMHLDYGQNKITAPMEEGFSESGEKIVTMAREFWRPAEVNEVKANPVEINRKLGWQPEHDLEYIIREMLDGTP